MPRVRYTAEGGHYRVAGQGFDPGDEADVDEELAEYLLDRDDFEPVEGESRDDSTETDVQDESEDADEADDVGFDVDAWLDQDYGDRADRVRDGDVDEYLEEIAENETSDTVLDAIGERRAELEG